jgi:CheY-like chemotaxis protein
MPKKILLVDDDPDILTIFEILLKSAGYDVLKAQSGEEAISTASKERPNLIVLDIKMPKMDGVETTDFLKENPLTRSIPIVYLSNLVKKDQVEEGYVSGSKIGNVTFISKSASPEEILAIISKKIK